MTKKKAMEYSNGEMEDDTKVNGSMGNNMESACIPQPMDSKEGVSGEMEEDTNG